MPGAPTSSFNLPWHQHDHYWISLYAKKGGFSPTLTQALKNAGLYMLPGQAMGIQTQRDWKTAWDRIYPELKKAEALDDIEVAVTHGTEQPSEQVASNRKPAETMQSIAESLWVGDALIDGRIMCYLQPVVSTKDKVFGYESFVRAKGLDGSVIGGQQVVKASRALGIEHMIDRHLHAQAIKTFVSSEFNGFLFINFFPGFIHRPAVYLERLSETAKSFGIIAKHIVLDFTQSEKPHDIIHLKNVCDYARSSGYSIALDDIASLDRAKKLIPQIQPDFVKIDMHLIHKVHDPAKRDLIREIADLVHASRSAVIAEGVETEEAYQALRQVGVDLFQGYLFSPPVPVETVLKRSSGAM